MYDYNSQRVSIILKEYGRNIQDLVRQLGEIEDREERNRFAYTLVELMRQLNPAARETHETAQKVWDDLHIISNFELDLDGPYPKPDPSIIEKKPLRMEYPQGNVRFKHYGRNLERMVEEVVAKEDEEEKEAGTIFLGKMMKNFGHVWNKENVDDMVILKQIKELSKGELTLDTEMVQNEKPFEVSTSNNNNNNYRNQGGGGGGRRSGGGGGGRGRGGYHKRRRN